MKAIMGFLAVLMTVTLAGGLTASKGNSSISPQDRLDIIGAETFNVSDYEQYKPFRG